MVSTLASHSEDPGLGPKLDRILEQVTLSMVLHGIRAVDRSNGPVVSVLASYDGNPSSILDAGDCISLFFHLC